MFGKANKIILFSIPVGNITVYSVKCAKNDDNNNQLTYFNTTN